MISRRVLLGCLIATSLAACVDSTNYKPLRPYMSLPEILAALPHIQTEEELIAAFGPPDYSRRFLEPGGTRDYWKKYFDGLTPLDLLDTLPPETKLVGYQVMLSDAINPWVSDLYIAIDAEGRVVGWMHQGSKYKKDMGFYHGR